MAGTTWVTMRDAYERYKASVKDAIKFDSFRRWVALGKIKARKPKGARFKEISLQDLNSEIGKLRGKPSRAKKSTRTKKDGPRRGRGRRKKASVTDRVVKALGDTHLRELRVSKKRPDLVQKTLDSIADPDIRKFLTAYISALEHQAIRGPETVTQTLVL